MGTQRRVEKTDLSNRIAQLLTTQELASKWGVSSALVRRLRLQGRISGIQKGKIFLFDSFTEKPTPIKPGRKH